MPRNIARDIPFGVAFTWDELVRQIEQRWPLPEAERFQWLWHYIRYAILVPLTALHGGTDILSEMAAPLSVVQWAQDCVQASVNWSNAFYALQEECEKRGTPALRCQSLLLGIGSLLNDSRALLDKGNSLAKPEDRDARAMFDVALGSLAKLSYIAKAMVSQDLSWLMDYVESDGSG